MRNDLLGIACVNNIHFKYLRKLNYHFLNPFLIPLNYHYLIIISYTKLGRYVYSWQNLKFLHMFSMNKRFKFFWCKEHSLKHQWLYKHSQLEVYKVLVFILVSYKQCIKNNELSQLKYPFSMAEGHFNIDINFFKTFHQVK